MIRVNRYADEYWDGMQSTSLNTLNKNFEWVNDGTGDIDMFVDFQMFYMDIYPRSRPRYVWLLESKSVAHESFEMVAHDSGQILDRCDGIFTCDEELAKLPGIIYSMTNAVPWVLDFSGHEKTKLVSMISSTKNFTPGHELRLQYVEKFRDKVDLFGRGHKDLDRKEDGLQPYMFSIAIENADYPCYFTEKLTDCFATKTIPVFYGTKAVQNYFDTEGVIFLDDDFKVEDLSADLYYSMLDSVEYNHERSQNMTTADDYIAEIIESS